MTKGPAQWLIKSFLKGLLLTVPLVVTLWVVYALFRTIDGILRLPIPGAGFLLTVSILIIIGAMGSNILVRRAVLGLESLLNRLPFVKLIYFSLKDLIGAFVGEKKSFKFPVLVTLQPGSEVKLVGFVTSESLDWPGVEGQVAVYLPQSYNYSGFLVVVPRSQIVPLPPEESSRWLAFIVSGGVSGGRPGEQHIGGEDFSLAKFPQA